MNGSSSLNESDLTPLYYCPECDAKLWWACKPEPGARAGKLAGFAKRHSLADESMMWEKIAKALGA